MPRTSLSKVKGLHKMHNRGCSNKGTARPTACSCPWFGKHKGVFKALLKFMWVRNWLKGLQEAQ